MTDPHGQSTENPAPADTAEAAEMIRRDPALTATPPHGDPLTDDDARTPDSAISGETQQS